MDEKEKDIRRISNYINKMPSLSTTVAKILEICNDPNTSPADLNQIIGLDPVLMGKVMKLINSAYYGLSQEITSLARAIIMLGINTVKNLSLSTAILGKLYKAGQFQAINMEGFWRHSLAVGVIAKYIAKYREVDPKFIEEYFISGLLHDIGKIPLNNVFPEKYLMSMSLSDRNQEPLYKSEGRVLPVSHSKVGELIAKSWCLGPVIKSAIGYHHDTTTYDGKHKEVVYTVAVADYFAAFLEIGFSGNRYPEKPSDEVMKFLGISTEILDDIEDVVHAEIEKASVFLQVSN